MRKAAILLTTFILAAGLSSGHPFNMDMIDENNTEHLVEESNYFAQDAPEFLSTLIGDQVINVRIDSENSTEEVGVRLNGANVTEIRMETYSDATLEVNTTADQIRSITASENPVQAVNNKLQKGEIEYESKGAINSIRTLIAEQLLSVAATA